MNLLLALGLLLTPAFAEGPKQSKAAPLAAAARVHAAPAASPPRTTLPPRLDGVRLDAHGARVQTAAGGTAATAGTQAPDATTNNDVSAATPELSRDQAAEAQAAELFPGKSSYDASESAVEQAREAAHRAATGSTDFSVEFDRRGKRTGDVAASYPRTLHSGESVENSAGTLERAVEAVAAPKTDVPKPATAEAPRGRWDRWTERLTGWAALPFMAMQAPQIVSNARFLLEGQADKLANLPWMGYSTGILGNMLLLAYFVSIRQKNAARVQAIGVATSAVVVIQIFIASVMHGAAAWAMPAAAFFPIMAGVAGGLALSFLSYRGKVAGGAWAAWVKATGLLGFVALPQALWSTFLPAHPSFLPAALAFSAGLLALALDYQGKLTGFAKRLWDSVGAKTATILFMYGSVAQLLANHLNPAGMEGLAVGTLLLGMAGNLFMLPRAMRVGMKDGDWTWFVGSFGGVSIASWAVLVQMAQADIVAAALPAVLAVAVAAYLAGAFVLNRRS